MTGPEFDGKIFTPDQKLIRRFEDIPGILSLKIPEIDYLVPALQIPRKSICVWCGPDGSGKTYLCEAMSVAVARGGLFLGERCLQCPAIYLDLENPAGCVQQRFRLLIDDENDLPKLKVWGVWAEQQPPRYGSDLLIEIVRQVKPLIVVDPFRNFHDLKENESDAMACVMTHLRALREYGATIILLHHPSKAEGSNGRGSSVIHASADVAILQSLDADTGLVTLRLEKNRNGAKRTLTVRADFAAADFEITDPHTIAAAASRNNEEDLRKLEKIICAIPRSTQNAIINSSGMKKQRVVELLKQGLGKLWQRESGRNKSILYSPLSGSGTHLGPTGTHPKENEQESSGLGGSPFIRGGPTTQPPTGLTSGGSQPSADRTLPACPACGSFAIYKEPDGSTSCMTCENRMIQ